MVMLVNGGELAAALEENAKLFAENRILRDAVIAMAEEGWLLFGPEGMSEAQKKCYEAYKLLTPNAALTGAAD